jgi:hypothetical protein
MILGELIDLISSIATGEPFPQKIMRPVSPQSFPSQADRP